MGLAKNLARAVSLAAVVLASLPVAAAIPAFEEVRAAHVSSEAWLLDRHGEPLQALRLDFQGRRLEWTPIEEISPALTAAVVFAEDRRFAEHSGVDWVALGAAALGRTTGVRRGGSTLAMQLAGFLDPGLAPRKGSRTLAQKWAQIQAARELDSRWSKSEILEAYLNLAPFRGERRGVAAAAWGLFGKAPSGLDQSESLILAALLPSPLAGARTVARRACALAHAWNARPACPELETLAATALDGALALPSGDPAAPHVAQKLLQVPGERVRTSLDAEVQRFAAETLREHIARLEERNLRDGAVLVADNATGEILAYVGNGGEQSSARHVDGVQARRQAGSTLKPFLYALAIEKRLLTAASLLEDSPLNIATPAGLYLPQNYDRDYRGWVSVRTALASSLNVPAVRTLLLTGLEEFHGRLGALGYEGLTAPPEHYGYGLALGGAEVSLWEQVNAYRSFANGGLWSELRLSPAGGAAKSRRVMSADAAFIVSDVLADRGARSVTFGLESPLATRFWTAVKTGTSKDMRDNWCIGYSSKFTVGVWVGNFSGEPMWDVSGVSGAAPVWHEIMRFLHAREPGLAPRPSSGVTALRITYAEGTEPPREEWFLRGTQMAMVKPAARTTGIRIGYPGNGTIIALDPDIPAGQQRVFFEASAGFGVGWMLDGEPLVPEALAGGWDPTPGPHGLTLTDRGGRQLDAVSFTVRGARP